MEEPEKVSARSAVPILEIAREIDARQKERESAEKTLARARTEYETLKNTCLQTIQRCDAALRELSTRLKTAAGAVGVKFGVGDAPATPSNGGQGHKGKHFPRESMERVFGPVVEKIPMGKSGEGTIFANLRREPVVWATGQKSVSREEFLSWARTRGAPNSAGNSQWTSLQTHLLNKGWTLTGGAAKDRRWVKPAAVSRIDPTVADEAERGRFLAELETERQNAS